MKSKIKVQPLYILLQRPLKKTEYERSCIKSDIQKANIIMTELGKIIDEDLPDYSTRILSPNNIFNALYLGVSRELVRCTIKETVNSFRKRLRLYMQYPAGISEVRYNHNEFNNPDNKEITKFIRYYFRMKDIAMFLKIR